MTHEDKKQLLLKDLCSRLPYKVKCNVYNRIGILVGLNDYGAEIDYGNGEDTTCEIKFCKPYLRSMSSMTEEERTEYLNACGNEMDNAFSSPRYSGIDWLLKNHFDFRTDDEGKTLIENGLAIEVKDNNPYL